MSSQVMGSGGAIFMSSYGTRYECFKLGLFGLPSSFARFVFGIKAGMTLFLFEYEGRKLYGVFEAISDGAMNIAPNAYRCTGRSFPAQVRFRIIWNCRPLLEEEFRDAIKENYYASYKFSFGLSQEQVNRLLSLFSSRKVRVQRSLKARSQNWCPRPSKRLKSMVVSETVLEKDFPPVESEVSIVSASIFDGENAPMSAAAIFQGTEDFIPLSSPEESQDSDAPTCNMPRVKGMYSDNLNRKSSIFSRLKLMPKSEVHKADRSSGRTSVFARLSFASKASIQEKDVMKSLDESLKKIKEQKRSVQNLVTAKEKEPKTRVDEHLKQAPSEGSYAGKEKCGSCEVLIRSGANDDVEICSSQRDMVVPSVIPLAASGVDSGDKVEGLVDNVPPSGDSTESDEDMLVEEPKPFITYQRRRLSSASPSCIEVPICTEQKVL